MKYFRHYSHHTLKNLFWPPVLSLLLFASPADSVPPLKNKGDAPKAGGSKIVAIIPHDAPPTYYRDSRTGSASGFAVEVLNTIAQQEGLSLVYIFGGEWAEIMGKIDRGEADVIPGMGITEERKKTLAFTEPIDTFPISLFVRSEGKSIKRQESGLRVGVLAGSVAYEHLKKQNKITLRQYEGYKSGLFDLLAGRIDAFSCPQPTLLELAREAGVDYRIRTVKTPVAEITRALAVRKDNTVLLKRLNIAVNRFVGSPEYQKMYLKWYGKNRSSSTLTKVIIAMSGGIIVAVVLMALWRSISLMKLNRALSKGVAELRLAEQNRIRLETAITAAADAIVLTDARGIIQYVNPAFERITGFTREEATGRDLHLVDGGKYNEAFFQEMREVLRRDGVWTGRLTGKKKDNTLYEEECTYSVVRDNDGRIMNYVAIKRDISEKMRFESIAAAMDNMNNIGYIFSGVRHEIGNPINAARLLLNLIKKRLSDLGKPAIENYLDQSLTQIAKVDYLLSTLRNFNMYEKLDIQHIGVCDFLEKFLFLIKEDFGSKGIEISVWTEPGLNVIFADRRALQQVLLNIFANASDAVQGRKSPKISLELFHAERGATILIKDNGIGMTEEEQSHLFKPFYTTKAHGTGLGMVIVKKMLTGMNSTIEVRSRKDKGTVMEITLPDRLPSKPVTKSQPSHAIVNSVL